MSSSLARNRIRLSINTRDKVVNATLTTTTKTGERLTIWERQRSGNGRHVASRATNHLADPIFFKRPAHSSWPDSLTIIKRKSFYSAVSFCLRSYFLPPVSNLPLLSLSFSPSLSPSLLPFSLCLSPRCAFAPFYTFSFFFSLLSILSIGPLSPLRFDIVPGTLQVILLSNYSHLLGKKRHCRLHTG